MPLPEPVWWYGPEGTAIARMLGPASRLWARMAVRRFDRTMPYRARLPVICIGNLTAGGTGKTPLALHVARELIDLGRRPVFLSRGYGGRQRGPHWVDATRDRARDIGDEPLLLARVAATMIARDRGAGARAIEQRAGAFDVVVMDDGLQNPTLAKDVVFAVVDGRRGIGNGAVIPAGPLRAPLAFQLGLVDAIVINRPQSGPAIGEPARADAFADRFRAGFPGPVLEARATPVGDVAWLTGARLVAYAGIGAPERFFGMLRALGAEVVGAVPLADHQAISERRADGLLAAAQEADATLVTTEKDWVRLTGAGPSATALQAASRVLPIALEFTQQDRLRLRGLLEGVLVRPPGPTG